MTRYFLTELAIEGFRGVNNESYPLTLAFRFDAVNSVFAVNGLGKSSIFEALSYAIRGRIPKLDVLPAADEPQAYYVNRFHSGQKATIRLKLTPDDGNPMVEVVVERSAKGLRTVTSPSGHPDPESLLRALDGTATLLDHQTFDSFVDDTPLKRGRAFSALVGLGRLSEYRQALEMLSNARTLKSDFDLDTLDAQRVNSNRQAEAAQRRIHKAYAGLVGLAPPQPLNGPAIAAAAHATLLGIPLAVPFVTGKSFSEVKFTEIQAAVKQAEASDKRLRLAEVLKEIDKLSKLADETGESSAQDELRAAILTRDIAMGETRGLAFQKLYEAAERVIEPPTWQDPHTCPLCETQELATSITDHVTSHLLAYTAAREAQALIPLKWTAGAWVQRMKTLDVLFTPQGTPKQSPTLDETFRLKIPSVADLDEAINLLARLEIELQARIAALEEESAALEEEIPPSLVTLTEQLQKADELQSSLVEYESQTRAAAVVKAKLDRRQRWCEFIGEACRTFADAEVALSTSQTLAIEQEYRALYDAVAQNPDVVPRLKKAPGSEELHLRLERFYGLSDLAAATLLPESYRNALAICIFLSAVQKAVQPAGFLVLDDITSSFDAGHQFALMEVLRTKVAWSPANPSGPQVIILSHDGLLEKYFDTLSNGTDWHHQRLQGMPPQGAVLSQTQDAQRLRISAVTFLKAGQTSQAFPLIRQNLEYALLQIIRKVDIPVPLDFSIRDDKKMAENCLTAIRDAVDLHEKAGDVILPRAQRDALRKVNAPKIIANWIIHYATGNTSSISPHVLLGLLTAVDEFVDCFKYDCKCSGGPQRRFYKSLSKKACGC